MFVDGMKRSNNELSVQLSLCKNKPVHISDGFHPWMAWLYVNIAASRMLDKRLKVRRMLAA